MAQNLIARALAPQLGPQPDRYINGVLSPGVWDLAGDHFKVVEQAAPGMSVRAGSGVAGDMAVVEGAAALSGRYIIQNPDPWIGSGDAELSIGNGDPSDPRIDLVVLRLYDDEMDSSGLTVPRAEVVPGTPASSPAVPATPAGAIALASILVGPNESGSIENADITDLRGEAVTRGQYVETVKFTADDTFDKADYPYLRDGSRIRARVQGDGGGSGGCGATGAGAGSGSGGGGGGGYCEKWLTAGDLAPSEPVTVGQGGTLGATGANAGGAGTGSSFAGLTAGGGGGGDGGGAATAPRVGHSGGAGGTATGGDINIPGGRGHAGYRDANTCVGAFGGDSYMASAAGTAVSGASVAGEPGGLYGGGAAGAACTQSQGARAGREGGAGIVLLDLYA